MSLPDILSDAIQEGHWTQVRVSYTFIARLLADKLTPDFNFKEQLWYIARAKAPEAAEYLCLLLRTQFGFQPKEEGESFFHDCHTNRIREVHGPLTEIVSRSRAKHIARRALVLRDARQRLQNDPNPFPFLKLPFDIRLHVYEFVYANNPVLEADYDEDYAGTAVGNGWHWEDVFKLRARTGIFGTDINTALLLTNQQIFNEAEPILYQTRFLKIGVHLKQGLRFLRSLSPRARQNIRLVHITLPYFYVCDGPWTDKLNDRLEAWCKLCDYMSQNLGIRGLSFNAVVEAVPANFVDAPWVEHLVKIRGLKHLTHRDRDPDDFDDSLEFYGSEAGPEPDPESYKGLNSRLQGLQSYLKSGMLKYPASRTEKEILWGWDSYFREDWTLNEEPET